MCYSLWYNEPIVMPAGTVEAQELRFHATGRQHPVLLCVTTCSIMHPFQRRPVAWKRRNSVSVLPAGDIVGALHYKL